MRLNGLVETPRGAVAWIATRHDDVARTDEITVETLQGSTRATLDTGPGIDRSSLAYAGGHLYWTHDGAARSATLGATGYRPPG